MSRRIADSTSIAKLRTQLFSIPNWCYWAGFVVCDIVSLAIQTVGGVEVSNAQNLQDISHGGSVMRAGIIFQFSNTIVFAVLVLATILRLNRNSLTLLDVAGWPAMLCMCVSTLMVLLRNGYRIVELSDGWEGHVMRTEGYLIGLDMVPMAVAIGSFLIFSPSLFFFSAKRENGVRSQAGSVELGRVDLKL
jgi:RTA1 like protein